MSGRDNRELLDLLRKAVEMAVPPKALPRLAKVVAVKKAGGHYTCSVQAVLNDGSPDKDAPVVPDVQIPSLWAGPNRGLVCPPTVGEYCDLGYYGGDPNAPFITNFRPSQAPDADLNGLTLQHSPGIRLGFEPDGTVFVEAPRVKVKAREYAEVEAIGRITLKAPLVEIIGRVEVTGGIFTKAGFGGTGMEMRGQVKIIDAGLEAAKDLEAHGKVAADGKVEAGGNVESKADVKDRRGNVRDGW